MNTNILKFLNPWLLLSILALNGCALVPMVDSVQRSGINASGRQTLLHETLTDFHHALFWGASNEALDFVSPEQLDQMRTEFRNARSRGRVVDSNVELVDFSSDAYSANVEVTERFHDFATNSINSRLEKEQWEYSLYDGWKLVARERAES